MYIKDAQEDGVTEAEIKDAFEDLAAFIAAEIEEAFDRNDHPDEDGLNLVDEDDPRVINEKEDEEKA